MLKEILLYTLPKLPEHLLAYVHGVNIFIGCWPINLCLTGYIFYEARLELVFAVRAFYSQEHLAAHS